MRLIGLDPGLRNTGWGVIEIDGHAMRHVADGTVHSDGYTGEASANKALGDYVRKLGYKALGPIPKEVLNEPEIEPGRVEDAPTARAKLAKKEAA